MQHTFRRRLLGVVKGTPTAVLFTETGLLPIAHCRLEIALSYLSYLEMQPDDMSVKSAFRQSQRLAHNGAASWHMDLKSCPGSTSLSTSRQSLTCLVKGASVMVAGGGKEITGFSQIFSRRTEMDDDRYTVHVHSGALMPYLSKILIPQHRLVYTHFITSLHGLAVELLRHKRHKRRSECPVPREWRLCRLCRKEVEDEEHAFLHCTGKETLVSLFSRDARELPYLWKGGIRASYYYHF